MDQSVVHRASVHGTMASHGDHKVPLNGGLNGSLHGFNGGLHGLSGGINGSMCKINGLLNGLNEDHGKGGGGDHSLAQPMDLSVPLAPTKGLTLDQNSAASSTPSPTVSVGAVPSASSTSATADSTVTAMLISMGGMNGISPTVSDIIPDISPTVHDIAGINGVPLPPIPHTLVGGVGALDVHTVAASMDSSKRRRLTADERLQRSRERNRIHAKKTRLRKKQKMEHLQV